MDTERILVIGSNGLLGQKVAEQLVRGSAARITLASVENAPVRDLLSTEYIRLDITVRKDVREVVGTVNPDVIINCAAMTDVDACETERDMAWKINVSGVEHLVEAARGKGATIVHVSSDYVFDGKSGKSKLASENVLRTSGLPHFIARTMVLYGIAPGVKANFALWLIKSLKAGQTVRIVDDQIGNPTLADDLAFGLLRAVELEKSGVYNIAGRDIVPRFEFAVRLAKFFGLDPKLIHPIKTAQLRQPAVRPLRSGLITLKAEVDLGLKPSTIEEGLAILKSQLAHAPKL
jgi:dTDP-4-dehydrorhamnose reductase